MYGLDILCGISKVPFEIPHKISYPLSNTIKQLGSEGYLYMSALLITWPVFFQLKRPVINLG